MGESCPLAGVAIKPPPWLAVDSCVATKRWRQPKDWKRGFEGIFPERRADVSLCCAQADWADGPGRGDIERLYMCSGVLNGDAVVVFMRALCAVSQEELVPASPEEPARCTSSYLHNSSLVGMFKNRRGIIGPRHCKVAFGMFCPSIIWSFWGLAVSCSRTRHSASHQTLWH